MHTCPAGQETFIEPRGSLLCSQVTTNNYYPEWDETILCPYTILTGIVILSFHKFVGFWRLSFQIFNSDFLFIFLSHAWCMFYPSNPLSVNHLDFWYCSLLYYRQWQKQHYGVCFWFFVYGPLKFIREVICCRRYFHVKGLWNFIALVDLSVLIPVRLFEHD